MQTHVKSPVRQEPRPLSAARTPPSSKPTSMTWKREVLEYCSWVALAGGAVLLTASIPAERPWMSVSSVAVVLIAAVIFHRVTNSES